jgi:hypothetical protein
MKPGAPYNGAYNYAWQDFTAQSNTLTELSVTYGTTSLPTGVQPGYHVPIKLCTDINRNPAVADPCAGSVLATGSPTLNNFGATTLDIGDIAVTPGTTYYLCWFRPDVSRTWLVYWWGSPRGDDISNTMMAGVRGYNR